MKEEDLFMKKIFFLTEEGRYVFKENSVLEENFYCEFFFDYGENFVKKVISEIPELIVCDVDYLSESNEAKLKKLLTSKIPIPFVLCGKPDACHEFYSLAQVNIIRLIHMPTTLNYYVETLKDVVKKVEGDKEKQALKNAEKKTEYKPKQIKKVLVVDDDLIALRTVMNWIKGDYRVSVAKSAAAAFEYLEKEIPDLILLDYEMPVMNGVQALEIIRNEKRFKDIPVIFLTGVDDKELVKDAVKLRPQGYVLKTAGKNVITEKIAEVLK